ncbi:MAG: hypothetical protein HUK21_04025 [Fibrobacteraceae bacterium]|nr:hypothetical protein [Fibrobacteraceae bacterium]
MKNIFPDAGSMQVLTARSMFTGVAQSLLGGGLHGCVEVLTCTANFCMVA